eukprot:scaffold131632_cov48-Phaeocystis_antarctica.AAC.1
MTATPGPFPLRTQKPPRHQRKRPPAPARCTRAGQYACGWNGTAPSCARGGRVGGVGGGWLEHLRAVAVRPVAGPLALGISSRLEPPGAP